MDCQTRIEWLCIGFSRLFNDEKISVNNSDSTSIAFRCFREIGKNPSMNLNESHSAILNDSLQGSRIGDGPIQKRPDHSNQSH